MALHRDQIDVLQDDDRRRKRASDLGCGRDMHDAGSGEQHGRDFRRLAEQVAHGERLTGSGRSVEQYSALQVLAGGEQGLALLTDADDVVGNGAEDSLHQHDRRSGLATSSDRVE